MNVTDLNNSQYSVNNNGEYFVTTQAKNTSKIYGVLNEIIVQEKIKASSSSDIDFYDKVMSQEEEFIRDVDDYILTKRNDSYSYTTYSELESDKAKAEASIVLVDTVLITLNNDLETYNLVDSLIPVKLIGDNTLFNFEGVPTEITRCSLLCNVDINNSISGINVTIDIDHPSLDTEKLKITLISPDGIERELWYQDFESVNDIQSKATAYFNGKLSYGDWILRLEQDETTETNILNSASLTIYY